MRREGLPIEGFCVVAGIPTTKVDSYVMVLQFASSALTNWRVFQERVQDLGSGPSGVVKKSFEVVHDPIVRKI